MWWWGPGEWGWFGGLLMTLFWVGIIVVAVLLLRRELPNLRWPHDRSPALQLLEERYARGEISREEFLERRAVLLQTVEPPFPPAPPPAGTPADPGTPTAPVPPASAGPATATPPSTVEPPAATRPPGPIGDPGATAAAPPPPAPDEPDRAADQPTIPLGREPEDRP